MSVIVKNVSRLFGAQRALDDVSFEVPKGQVVGFLGPNGAGKSTMMKIICCFIPASSGNVSVNGYDVITQSVDVRRQIGYLPENNPLYYDMYVKEYLRFIAGIYRIPEKKAASRVNEIIEQTGLLPEKKKKIGALSRGYRQRVGLAQALIHDPPVLIMDEPTSGLDPNQLVEIRNLIRKTGKEKTVILSTHIMQEVQAICDRVIIINKGKLVADDSARLLQQKARNEKIFIIEFDKEVSRSNLRNQSFIADAENINGNQWKVKSTDNSDIRQQLFQFAVSNNLSVLKLDMQEFTLEEVFHQLTSG